MICETSTSPSSMTPSIISRASSSSRPSRCPSETMVRISSSNDSSSGSGGGRPERRWKTAATKRRGQPQRPQGDAGGPPGRPGVVEEGIGPQAGHAPGQPDFRGQEQEHAAGHAPDQQRRRRRTRRAPVGPDPERGGADVDGGGHDLERFGGQAHLVAALEDVAQPVGMVSPPADFLEFMGRELGQRTGPHRRQASHGQPGRRHPECCRHASRGIPFRPVSGPVSVTRRVTLVPRIRHTPCDVLTAHSVCGVSLCPAGPDTRSPGSRMVACCWGVASS